MDPMKDPEFAVMVERNRDLIRLAQFHDAVAAVKFFASFSRASAWHPPGKQSITDIIREQNIPGY